MWADIPGSVPTRCQLQVCEFYCLCVCVCVGGGGGGAGAEQNFINNGMFAS